MKWFLVTRTEYSGYDCDGHQVSYIVAANSAEEARSLFDPDESWEPMKTTVEELTFPDLNRKRKAFIYR